MNVNELLINTLSAHGPVYPDFYEGEEEKYITFNFPDESAVLFGDNQPKKIVVYVQVHLYLPLDMNYQDEKTQVCKELLKAGFKWPSITIMKEDDVRKRHIIFETKIKNTIN